MSWLFLIGGIALEVVGTVCMKLSEGFTRPLPSVLMFVFWGLGFVLLSLAIRRIDLSIAYALWSGMGVTIMTLIGIFWFGEYASLVKLVSIGLVVAGTIGLQLSVSAPHSVPAAPVPQVTTNPPTPLTESAQRSHHP